MRTGHLCTLGFALHVKLPVHVKRGMENQGFLMVRRATGALQADRRGRTVQQRVPAHPGLALGGLPGLRGRCLWPGHGAHLSNLAGHSQAAVPAGVLARTMARHTLVRQCSSVLHASAHTPVCAALSRTPAGSQGWGAT